LTQVEHELQLLKQSKSTHPDFRAQLACVDERRDQKLLYEDRLLGYNLQNLTGRTVGDRQQLHSQYFQEVRQIRDDAIKSSYQDLHALQRDRWRYGSRQNSTLSLYNPDRTDQLARQASYNLEVSLLSGIAKYLGFPAAPDMSVLATNEIESDLQRMGVSTLSPYMHYQSNLVLRSLLLSPIPSRSHNQLNAPWLNNSSNKTHGPILSIPPMQVLQYSISTPKTPLCSL
jgi:hypothetical protein